MINQNVKAPKSRMDKLKMEAKREQKIVNPQPTTSKPEPQDEERESDDRGLLVAEIVTARLFE